MPGAQVHSCHENAYIMLKEFAMPSLQCLAMPGQDPLEVKLVSDVRRSPGWHLAWLPWSRAARKCQLDDRGSRMMYTTPSLTLVESFICKLVADNLNNDKLCKSFGGE